MNLYIEGVKSKKAKEFINCKAIMTGQFRHGGLLS